MIMTARRLAGIWAASALAVLGLSFAPWFARTIQGSPHDVHVSVDAWSGSTQWQWAVVLTVIGAAIGAVTVTRLGRSPSLAFGVAAAMVTGAATCLWLAQWWAIAHPPPESPGARYFSVAIQGYVPEGVTWAIDRDSLATLARATRWSSAGQTWASYLGGGLIAVSCLLAVGLLGTVVTSQRPGPAE